MEVLSAEGNAHTSLDGILLNDDFGLSGPFTTEIEYIPLLDIEGNAHTSLDPVIPIPAASPIHEFTFTGAGTPFSAASPIHEFTFTGAGTPVAAASPVHEFEVDIEEVGDVEGNAHTTLDAVVINDNFGLSGPFTTEIEFIFLMSSEGNAHTTLVVNATGTGDVEGNAHTNLVGTQKHSVVGDAEGNAHTDLTASGPIGGEGDIEGNAHTTLDGGRVRFGVGDCEGNAHTSLSAISVKGGIGDCEGNAHVDLTGGVRRNSSMGCVGNSHTTCYGELFIQVLQSATTGSVIDQTDPNVLSLTIVTTVTTTIDFSEGNYCLEDISVDYDGKELTFSEIATPGLGSPNFPLDAQVGLSVDWSNGVTPTLIETLFIGRIRSHDVTGENKNQRITYSCLGTMNIADEVTMINTTGKPDLIFTVGLTVTSVTSSGTEIATTFSKTVREALQDLFTLASSSLAANSIPATIGYLGLNQFQTQLPETLDLSNLGFTSAILQTAQKEVGMRPFFDSISGTWLFYDLLNAPTAKVNISSTCVLNLNYNKSIEDRYTAVHLYAETDTILDDPISTKSETLTIKGNTGTIQRAEVTVEKDWLHGQGNPPVPNLELDWSLPRALARSPQGLEDKFFWVYKRWSIPTSVVPAIPGTPVNVYQKVNFHGEERWLRLKARVDFGRKRKVVSRYHAINLDNRGNPFIPGGVKGPLEVKIAYWPLQFSFNYPTSITSEGTPTSFITTLIDSSEFPDDVRVPPTGFEGNAYTDYGIERVYTQIVDRTEVTTENAQAILDRHKDVVVTGDIPFPGDPIRQFINLGRKVSLSSGVMATGIETTLGLQTGYSYTFGKPGESSISLTTDVFGLIGK